MKTPSTAYSMADMTLTCRALGLEIKRLSESTNIMVGDSQQTLASIQQMTLELQGKVDLTNNATTEARKDLDSVRLESRRSAICDWLSASDPSTDYQLGCRNRHATTGSWFLRSEKFLQWTINQNSILWLYGKAGCGKTVLSSTIITELRRQCNLSHGASLAYFFFDFNDPKKQQPSHMIRSLITQLLRLSDALLRVDSLYTSCSDGQDQADDEGLLKILKDTAQESNHTYIVLDALDECSDVEYLSKTISEVVKWEIPSLHLLFTSRWLTLIEETVQDLSSSEQVVMIQSKLIDADISDYVVERLRTDKKLQRWRRRLDIQEEIRSIVTKGSNGMWVSEVPEL